MKTIFRKYKSKDRKRLEELIQLFSRGESGRDIPRKNIERTIREFSRFPEKGAIYVFITDKKIIGYAISVNYWSINAGGNFSAVDEIFVDVAWRGKGIATAFIDYLKKIFKKTSVAISLEVGVGNKKAKK
ncbi:MAG: GNAT family N-acetyltransferase, partial [Candidatus Moraniibacteriota bacterium]